MGEIVVDARMLYASGIGVYLSNLLPRVIRLCADVRFFLLGPADRLSSESWTHQPNVKVLDCTCPIYSVQEQLKLVWKCLGYSRALWVPHYNIPLLWPGKLVVTVHDVNHLALQRLLQGWTKKTYARFMFAAVRAKAHEVICVSEFTKKELMNRVGVDAARITVVHNGIDEKWFDLVKDEESSSSPYLLFVGNVKPHKNLVRLIQAFALLIHRIPHNLLIVGTKEGLITLDSAALEAAAALGDRVQFTGHVSQSDLFRYFANAAALTFPSLYEGFGFPPLEAMAAGCPVLVSNQASLPEVCGKAAVYFNPYDIHDIAEKMELMVSDPSLTCLLRDKGRERAREFSWDVSAMETVSVLRKLLN